MQNRTSALYATLSLVVIAFIIGVSFAQADPSEEEYADALDVLIGDEIRAGRWSNLHPQQWTGHDCIPANKPCGSVTAPCQFLTTGSACHWCTGTSEAFTFCADAGAADYCSLVGGAGLKGAAVNCGRKGTGTCGATGCTGAAPGGTAPPCQVFRCTAG